MVIKITSTMIPVILYIMCYYNMREYVERVGTAFERSEYFIIGTHQIRYSRVCFPSSVRKALKFKCALPVKMNKLYMYMYICLYLTGFSNIEIGIMYWEYNLSSIYSNRFSLDIFFSLMDLWVSKGWRSNNRTQSEITWELWLFNVERI